MILDPLSQIHPITMAGIVVIFLVTLLLLRRVFFLPLLTVMERRAARIEAARAGKAEAERLLARARVEAEQALSGAREEATRLADRVEAETAALRTERLARASAEAEAILAGGREEVLALARAQEARLAEELHACVTQALTRMIGTVDDAAVRLVMKRVLAAKEAG
jgi:F-type H+-transporting ATPase subunit b